MNEYQLLPNEFGKIGLHTRKTALEHLRQFRLRGPAMILIASVVAKYRIQEHRPMREISFKNEIRDDCAADISFWGVGIHLLSLSSCILCVRTEDE